MIPTDTADRAISRLAVSIACFVYLIGCAGYSFQQLAPARYLVYTVPAILFGSLLFQRFPRLNQPAAGYLLAYLSMAFAAYLIGIPNLEFALTDFVIIVVIGLSFIPKINVSADHIRIVFFCSLGYLALNFFLTGDPGIRFLQMLKNASGSGLVDAYSDHTGLVGPIYAVFFCAVGAKIEFLLALIMTLLGGKRVGVLALFIGLVSIVVFRRSKALKCKRNRFIALFAALAVINFVASELNSISEYLYAEIRPDAHIEAIMLGRYMLGSEIDNAIVNRSLLESLFGFGPGSANALATRVSNGVLGLPHNDWLKILYDYGILGSVAITAFMALVFSSSTTAAVIALTSAVIMATDNVIVYLFYQFPIVLMLAYSARRQHSTPSAMQAACPGAAIAGLVVLILGVPLLVLLPSRSVSAQADNYASMAEEDAWSGHFPHPAVDGRDGRVATGEQERSPVTERRGWHPESVDLHDIKDQVPAPAPSTTCPAGAIVVAVGQSVQATVNAVGTNATICIKAGVHRLQEIIVPKSGQTFTGESGATLSGAKLLTNFTREGDYYVAIGQTQRRAAPAKIGRFQVCMSSNPRCYLPQDLFINDVPLEHVDTLSKVATGKYFFDYAAGKIYFMDDPAGKRVETSVALAAFSGTAANVTIKNLVIEKYANPAQTSALGYKGVGAGWIIRDCIVRLNHGGGIEMGIGIQVLQNKIQMNGQIGIRGSGSGGLVEGNEISWNNFAKYDYGFEAGGTKFSFTRNLAVRGNYAHHNFGPGLWTDIDNRFIIYENNHTAYNHLAGIFHEISFDAIIRNNTLEYEQCNWRGCNLWYNSAIKLVDSSNVQVYGNTIRYSKNGISVVGDDRAGTRWPNQNNTIQDNTIISSPQALGSVGANMGGIVFLNNNVSP